MVNLVSSFCHEALMSAFSLADASDHNWSQEDMMVLGMRSAGSHSDPSSKWMIVVAHLPGPENLHMRAADALNLASRAGAAPVASTP